MDLVQLTPRSLAHETKKYLGDVLPTVTDALTELTIAQPPDPFAFLGAFFLNRSNNETVREFAQAVMKGKVPQMDEKTRFLSEEQNQEILDFSNNRRLVQELFDKLDTNKNYTLEITELKNIIECYEGADYSFDANEFMQWYDKDRKNSTKDNALDIDEFGEYIAHLAWVYGQPDIKEAAEVFALITAQFQQCFVTLQTRTAPKGFVLDPVHTPTSRIRLIDCGGRNHCIYLDEGSRLFKYSKSSDGTAWEWREQPGKHKYAAIGADGRIFSIDRDGVLWRWDEDRFAFVKFKYQPDFKMAKVSLGLSRWLTAQDEDQRLYRYSHSKRSWIYMEYSSADKVAVGSDGDIWCIDSNTMLKRYDWRRQDFIRIYFPPEGDPVRDVSVGDKRDIWSVSSKGNLLRYQGSKVANHLKWEKMAENTKLVAVGPDGAVMTVQSDGIVALHTP